MQLTHESRRSWWLAMVTAWTVCALLIALHAKTVGDYLRVVDGMGARAGPAVVTPMRHVIPSRFADAQMWVRYAVGAEAAGQARVRFTRDDNAPHGREVHWASPLLWLVRASAVVTDIEQAILWFNGPLFLGVLIFFSSWAARRAGAAAGVLVALAMVGHNRFYDSFAPANVDHHGLLIVSVFGVMLGLVFMGAGWWKPNLG